MGLGQTHILNPMEITHVAQFSFYTHELNSYCVLNDSLKKKLMIKICLKLGWVTCSFCWNRKIKLKLGKPLS